MPTSTRPPHPTASVTAILRPLLLLAAFLILAGPSSALADDEAAITAVIDTAYVQGVWIQRDPDLVRAGFAPTFVMQVPGQSELSSRTLDEWIERMNLDRKKKDRTVSAETTLVAQTGDAAIAQVELFVDDTHAYTDFFGLYRTAEGWKIVSKLFHSHRP